MDSERGPSSAESTAIGPVQEQEQDEGEESSQSDGFRGTTAYQWGRDIAIAFALVATVSVLIVAVTGVWPPLAAVSSGSMDPNIQQGDVVVIMEEGRFSPGAADENDIVTRAAGVEAGYRSLGDYGSVIVFVSSDTDTQATVHRAMFYVEEGENWYEGANETYLNGAESCSSLRNCPAPNAGYITKGDANPSYDQALGMSPPIRDRWVVGTARQKVPFVGWFRLLFGG